MMKRDIMYAYNHTLTIELRLVQRLNYRNPSRYTVLSQGE